MDNPRIKFYLEKNSFWTHSASILLGLAIVFQFIGRWGLWTDRFALLTELLLPLASYALFILILNLLGNKLLWLSVLPFLGGVAFFGLHAWNVEDKLSMVIGITYCVLAAVLYSGTVLALIRTKWLLIPLFGIPFCYRAFYRDVLLLQDVENPVHFSDGMREMSLLCVLLSLTLLAIGLKKLVKERRAKGEKAEENVAKPESAPVSAPVSPAPLQEPSAPAAEKPFEESVAVMKASSAQAEEENGEA